MNAGLEGRRVLVIDDEPGVREALEAILSDEGFLVASAESGEEGLRQLDSERFDAVLLDVWLPGIDGLETLKQLRERNIDAEVVMISGHGTIDTAVRATKLGAFDFVEKPLSLEKTLLVVRNALRQTTLVRRNRSLLEQLSADTEFLGRSEAAGRLRSAIEVAAMTDAPVLICGEPGSGREAVARRIHASGPYPDAPLVTMPCAAVDESAAERALWGEDPHPGRIDLAAGGSLLLEDVDRLPQVLQHRLAATLSDGDRAAPGTRPLATIAGDRAPLSPGLRQQLDVIRIDVPVLRRRREDIDLLAERFMRDLSREYGREPKRWSRPALAALKTHDWPGNVRELRNLVERLLLFAPEDSIRAEDLPEDLGGRAEPASDLYGEFATLQDGLRAFETYYVRRILREEGDNRAAAARRLGITPTTLARRLKALSV